MPSLTCQFPLDEMNKWAEYYGDPAEDTEVIDAGKAARSRGYYTRDEFLLLGDWKTPRVRAQRKRNNESFVNEVTRVALTTPNERLRIEILTLLHGVNWATASVLLHLAHTDPYPIFDYRALESLGLPNVSECDYPLWTDYTQCCRQLASQAKIDMRTLDRALWGYSKANPL